MDIGSLSKYDRSHWGHIGRELDQLTDSMAAEMMRREEGGTDVEEALRKYQIDILFSYLNDPKALTVLNKGKPKSTAVPATDKKRCEDIIKNRRSKGKPVFSLRNVDWDWWVTDYLMGRQKKTQGLGLTSLNDGLSKPYKTMTAVARSKLNSLYRIWDNEAYEAERERLMRSESLSEDEVKGRMARLFYRGRNTVRELISSTGAVPDYSVYNVLLGSEFSPYTGIAKHIAKKESQATPLKLEHGRVVEYFSDRNDLGDDFVYGARLVRVPVSIASWTQKQPAVGGKATSSPASEPQS